MYTLDLLYKSYIICNIIIYIKVIDRRYPVYFL